MKSIRKLIIALVVVMSAALLVAPTFAQDNTPTATPPAANNSAKPPKTRTITITQEQINTRLANRHGERFKDLSIVLGDNQITVSFTTKGDKKGNAGKAIVAVVTPGVVDGKVSWTFNSLTIDGTAATQDQMDKLKERITNLIGKFGERQRRFTVTSISVDSSAITVTLTRTKLV